MKRHVECVHEGIKPWKCVACDANFSEKSKLTMHYTKFHEGKTPEDEGFFQTKPRKSPSAPKAEKPKCEICNKTFRKPIQLKTHIETIHEGKKPYMCDLCGTSFSKTIQLQGRVGY